MKALPSGLWLWNRASSVGGRKKCELTFLFFRAQGFRFFSLSLSLRSMRCYLDSRSQARKREKSAGANL
jgi:hypothetical protein